MTSSTPMKSILENELVRQYFAYDCGPEHNHYGEWGKLCNERVAMRILKSMEEPLNTWDLYLSVNSGVKVLTWENPGITDTHAHMWKLPDQFQPKKECEVGRCDGSCMNENSRRCLCCKNMQAHCFCYKPVFETPSRLEVEGKIKDLADLFFWCVNNTNGEDALVRLKIKLRELVELVRKEKK